MHTYQPHKTVQTGSPCLLFNLIMTTYGGPTATLTYKLYCANLSIVFWANNHAKIRIEANYQKFQSLIDLFSPVLCLSVFARTALTKTISCYHPLSQSLTKQFKSMVPNCPGQKRLKLGWGPSLALSSPAARKTNTNTKSTKLFFIAAVLLA